MATKCALQTEIGAARTLLSKLDAPWQDAAGARVVFVLRSTLSKSREQARVFSEQTDEAELEIFKFALIFPDMT
jgi:hypothetical protein